MINGYSSGGLRLRLRGAKRAGMTPAMAKAKGRRLALLALPLLLQILPAGAQTTTGNVANGQALFGTRGCGGCHGTTPPGGFSPAIRNAANAGGIVGLATARNMGGFNAGSFTQAQENDLAAYIATAVANPNPSNQTVAYNATTTIALPDIYLNTTYGAFSSVQAISAPAKGQVVFTAASADYTPSGGQCGSDSFTWQASGSFGGLPYSSNVRQVTVNIANPAAPNISTGSSTPSGGVGNPFSYTPTSTGGAPSSYAISGTPPAWLTFNTATGEIGGTPTAQGSFNVTITAFNCFNGNAAGQQGSKTLTITIGQGTQTIGFNGLSDRFSTDPPFVVSASGGGSGNPVTFTASGVCSHSGTNGSTITLSGIAGMCSVTANQAGNGNYLAAAAVTRSFAVAQNGSEVFPPNCQMPPGWTTPGGLADPWQVTSEAGGSSEGICALKTLRGFVLPPSTRNPSLIQFTGTFNAGNVSFMRRVEGDTFFGDCFRFLIDGVQQSVGGACDFGGGAAGVVPYGLVSVPIGAGTHTLTWVMDPISAFGSIQQNAWIDNVRMPLSTAITSSGTVSGLFGQSLNHAVTATNFPASYAAAGLPPGLGINATTGAIAGTPTAAGVYAATITVANPGGANPAATGVKTVTFSIDKVAQLITFPAIGNKPATAAPFDLSASGGGSGNPVVFSASGVCSAGGSNGATITLTGVAGLCTISADQAGTDNYHAAPRVTRSVQVDAVAPGAPTLDGAAPADGKVTLTFTAPASNGGSAITGYTATCGSVSVDGGTSPIVVAGLMNGVAVACSVRARNSVGAGSASGTLTVTPTALSFTGFAFSRKVHGNGVGIKELPVTIETVDGAITIEPRIGSGGHQLVFRFNRPVVSVGGISVTDLLNQTIGAGTAGYDGNDLIVTLTGIADGERATVAVTGVNGAVDVATGIGFLVGDVNGSQTVNAADISAVKARGGTIVDDTTFLFDLTLDGRLNQADVAAVKARSGRVLR